MKNLTKGQKIFFSFLIILNIGLIVGGGILISAFMKQNEQIRKPENSNAEVVKNTSKTDEEKKISADNSEISKENKIDKETLETEFSKLKIDYPKTWKVNRKDEVNNYSKEKIGNTYTFISPSGITMDLEEIKNPQVGGVGCSDPFRPNTLAKTGIDGVRVIDFFDHGHGDIERITADVKSAYSMYISQSEDGQEVCVGGFDRLVKVGDSAVGFEYHNYRRMSDDDAKQAIEIMSSIRPSNK